MYGRKTVFIVTECSGCSWITTAAPSTIIASTAGGSDTGVVKSSTQSIDKTYCVHVKSHGQTDYVDMDDVHAWRDHPDSSPLISRIHTHITLSRDRLYDIKFQVGNKNELCFPSC